MTDEVGLRIGGVLYPPPMGYTIGETRTIFEMTGLELPEWAAALERAAEKKEYRSNVYAAFVWVSMHKLDPSVKPEDVDKLDLTAIEAVGQGPPVEAATAPPPTEPEPTSSSDESAAPANGSVDTNSTVIPASFGARP